MAITVECLFSVQRQLPDGEANSDAAPDPRQIFGGESTGARDDIQRLKPGTHHDRHRVREYSKHNVQIMSYPRYKMNDLWK